MAAILNEANNSVPGSERGPDAISELTQPDPLFEVDFYIRFKPQTLVEVHPARHTKGERIPNQQALLFRNSRALRRAFIDAAIPASIADLWGWKGPFSVSLEQLKRLGFDL